MQIDSDVELTDLLRKDGESVLNQHNVRVRYQTARALMDPELTAQLDDYDYTHQAYYDLYCLMHYRFLGEVFFPERITRSEYEKGILDHRNRRDPAV